jgi:hypothetical protein
MLKIIYHYIIKILKFINRLNNNLLVSLNQKLHDTTLPVQIIQVEKNTAGRFLSIWISNNHLLDSYEALREIFNTLKSNKDFNNFGSQKIILISAIHEDWERSFTHNVLINDTTTFEEFFVEVEKHLNKAHNIGSPSLNDVIGLFKVRVFNMDLISNQHIKITAEGVKNESPVDNAGGASRSFNSKYPERPSLGFKFGFFPTR